MAALDKRWVGGVSAVWTLETNWAPINLQRPKYKWTVSGVATEYRLELIGGGDPGISAPPAGGVYLNGATVTSQAVGSLTAAHYGYGDNDTLGYSTIYVRTSASVDPDTLALDYVQLYQIPVATDHIRIPAGSGAITGVDFTAVAIGDFIREPGHTGAIGTAALPLMIDPDKFEWSGTGTGYIHSIGAIAHDVREAGGSQEVPGLFLTLTAGTTLTVFKGAVGVAWLGGQTSTVTTVYVNGPSAIVLLGKGVTVTTTYVSAGLLEQHCSATTSSIFGNSKFYTEEAGTITTVNMDGTSMAYLNSTGTITTLNMLASYTGTVDMSQSAEARTITTVNQKCGALRLNKTVVTIGTHNITDTKLQTVTVTN